MNAEELKQAEAAHDELIDEQKRKARLVQSMIDSEGFKIIEAELEADAKRLTGQLIQETDMVKVQSLQGELKALQKFTNKLVRYASIQG